MERPTEIQGINTIIAWSELLKVKTIFLFLMM